MRDERVVTLASMVGGSLLVSVEQRVATAVEGTKSIFVMTMG